MATSAEYWESSSYGPGDTNVTYEFLSAKSPNRYHLMRLLRKKGMREVGEILFTALAENTPSDTASVTISQLTSEADTTANVNGGVRTVAAKEIMGLVLDSDKDDATAEASRAATAADVTTLNAELIPSGATANRAPGTYPTDASGNGGGGKLD
tara:strand:- start:1010 stop:1471 length:462 start_codon:yes stop_codon:yes gene_type:complete